MPFVFPHRQTIAKMYAGLYPNSDPNMVTDLQLLQMRKQMIEASRIYPFKDKFEENFQKVFNFGAPDDEQPFWKLFYAMKDEYDLERFLRLVVPHAVMDATVTLIAPLSASSDAKSLKRMNSVATCPATAL